MPCSLTQNLIKDCANSVGGVATAYVTEVANITAIVTGSYGGTITSMSLASGSKFYKYTFRKQTGEFSEKMVSNDANGSLYFEPTVNFQFTRLENNKKNELRLLAQNEVAVAILDGNGSLSLTGYRNGLTLTDGSAGTGKALTDLNGYTLTLSGAEPEPMLFFSSSAVLTPLIAP